MRAWLLLALCLAGCGQTAIKLAPTRALSAAEVLSLAQAAPALAEQSPPRPGEVVGDFLLPALRGPACRLAQWRGRPTVLTFWAFWCDTWKEVHAGYAELRQRLGPDQPLVTICLDCQWTDQLLPLMDQGQVDYTCLTDPQSQVSTLWKVRAVPTVILLDSAGRLQRRWEGFPGVSVLVRELAQLSQAGERFSTAAWTPSRNSSRR